MYNNILLSIEDGIALITINRPKSLNALNTETLIELDTMIKQIKDDNQVKAVIITGTGRAFIAGADISEMKDLNALEGRNMSVLAQSVFNSIENMEKPVIAAVNGFALGGGCELAMACDIRIASNSAKFGQPEVNLGILPGFGGTQRLPRLVGKGMAKYMIFTGEMIDAGEALRIGLVEKVVPAEELISTAASVAKVITSKAPVSIRLAKHSINNGLNVDMNSGLSLEREEWSICFSTGDQKEGMSAFLEKRPADFQGK